MAACTLCDPTDERVLYRCDKLRVILADEPGYPGLCRVIWNAHRGEMTDLDPADRQRLIEVVWATERALRVILVPDKINLASLGNRVPHLHWHVIPRFRDDPAFPDAIWAEPRRGGTVRSLPPGFALSLRRELSNRIT